MGPKIGEFIYLITQNHQNGLNRIMAADSLSSTNHESPEEESIPRYQEMGFRDEESLVAFETMLAEANERQWLDTFLPCFEDKVKRERYYLENYWKTGQQFFSEETLYQVQVYLEWLRKFPQRPLQ